MKLHQLAVASAFALALQIPPASATTYSQKDMVSYGYALLAHGAPKDSITVFVGVLKAEPSNMTARRYLAHALLQCGQYQQAIIQFQELSKYISLQAVDESGLASAYLQLGDHKSALSYFEQALRLEPGYGPALVGLVKTHLSLSQNDEARAVCEKALQQTRDPNSINQLKSMLDQMRHGLNNADLQQPRPNEPG